MHIIAYGPEEIRLHPEARMNTLLVTLKYFLLITAELAALFLGISALVALLLMYIPREKMRRWMGGKGLRGNYVGALVGCYALLRLLHHSADFGLSRRRDNHRNDPVLCCRLAAA